MNSKMKSNISNFLNRVGEYLYMEYDPIYYTEFTKDKNLHSLFEFVGSYYLGGSTVPETSRYVVDFINRFILKDK